MKKKTLNLIYMHFIMKANVFIFLLSKLPIIKNFTPINMKKIGNYKFIFAIVSVSLTLLRQFITSTILLLLLIRELPKFIYDFFGYSYHINQGFILFIILYAILPTLTSCKIFKLARDDYMYLEYFHMKPASYYQYKIANLYIKKVLFIIPGLYLAFGPTFKSLFLLSLALITFSLGNVLYTKAYDRKLKLPKAITRYVFAFVMSVLSYALIMLNPITSVELLSTLPILTAIIAFAVTVLAMKWLFSYQHYLRLARKFVNSENLSLHLSVSTVTDVDQLLSVSNAEENKEHLKKYKELKGTDYIHKAFVHRHKKYINRFYRGRVIFIMMASIIASLVINYKGISLNITTVSNYAGIILAVTMMLCFSAQSIAMYFYQCDKYLMENQMFSGNNYVYRSFVQRFFSILKGNLIISTALFIATIAFIVLTKNYEHALSLLKIAALIVVLLQLHEFIHLLMYYLIQPFTKNGMVKKPIFKLVNLTESFIAIIFIAIKSQLLNLFIPASILLFILYLSGMFLVNRFGHRTFKL